MYCCCGIAEEEVRSRLGHEGVNDGLPAARDAGYGVNQYIQNTHQEQLPATLASLNANVALIDADAVTRL